MFASILLPTVAVPFLELHPIALLVSERVVTCLIAGSILTACAGLALRLMHGQTARSKFFVCFATLMAIAAVPLLGWFHAQTSAEQSATPVLRLPEDWAVYIFMVWAFGATIALGRVAFGLCHVWQVRRSCAPVDRSAIDTELNQVLQTARLQREVELCTSEVVRVPTAIGLWRPAIALPPWCLRDLSSEELHSVVLHELEHLRRYDDWTNLFQRVVGALFFFHPAVWWLESRLSLEREMACDDAVLAVVPDPKSYARCLVSLAEKSYLRRTVALAQAAVSRVQQLTARVTQILNVSRPKRTALWKPALSITVMMAFAGSASIELGPRLVAFGSNASATAVASVETENGISTINPYQSGIDGNALPAPTEAKWIPPAASHKLFHKEKASSAQALPHDPALQQANEQRGVAEHQTIAPVREATTALSTRPDQLQLDQTHQAQQVLLTLPVSEQDTTTQQSSAPMLVMVVRSEQYDANGVLWSVQIVRWTVFHPREMKRTPTQPVPTKT